MLEPAEIDAAYKDEILSLMEEHGRFGVPRRLIAVAQEKMRRAHEAYAAARDGRRPEDEPRRRRGRTPAPAPAPASVDVDRDVAAATAMLDALAGHRPEEDR
jgi:hypothetical protein